MLVAIIIIGLIITGGILIYVLSKTERKSGEIE